MDYTNNIIIKSIQGDLRQGGTLITATIYGDTDLISFGQNIRLLGRADTDTGYQEFFNGHVLETPDFHFDAFGSQAEIRIGTANYLMTGRLQDVAFTEQGSPANDHQIAPTMRISSCFSHIMNRHCNFVFDATETPDGIIFETSIDTTDTALARMNISKSNNFWSAIQNQLAGGEEGGVQFYRAWFNRKNKLFYQPPPAFQTSPPTAKGTLTKEHIRGRARVQVRNAKTEDITGQVQIVAVASANTVYESAYPALQPGDGRIVIKDSGIWADSQARTDTLAQNVYDWLTRPYTLILEVDPGLILFGDDGNGLDLGDAVSVTYDGPTEDTATGAGVHLNLSAAKYYVYKYQVVYDVQRRTARGTLELEADN